MRLYCKLALLTLLACATQSSISNGFLRETYFAARCLVANLAENAVLEERLVAECEREYAQNRRREIIAVAAYLEAPRQ